jgi:dTDP-4-amino-4,6-dideoxygalactose transaminase
MSGYKIPFVDLRRQYEDLREEILDQMDSVFLSGQMLDGPMTRAFENAMAKRCHRRHAITVNSGTQAICLALMAMTPPRNDGVMIPAVSFVATKNAVDILGRNSHVVDVDDQGLLDVRSIDIAPLKKKIGIMMYVNLYGNMVDQDKIRMYTEFFNEGLLTIEDAAQSFGAYWDDQPSGSFGDASILSFDPMKNLPNYGSGGMVLTDDDLLANEIRNFKDNGKLSGFQIPGTNSKMNEADCAAMMVKLGHFDAWQARRAEIAEYYDSRLADYVSLPQINPRVTPSWHKYVIQTPERDALQQYLFDHGVETKIHYAEPFAPLSNAIYLCDRVLSLPIYPEMTDSEVETVAELVISHWEDQIA